MLIILPVLESFLQRNNDLRGGDFEKQSKEYICVFHKERLMFKEEIGAFLPFHSVEFKPILQQRS